jgi:hypothetical protein
MYLLIGTRIGSETSTGETSTSEALIAHWNDSNSPQKFKSDHYYLAYASTVRGFLGWVPLPFRLFLRNSFSMLSEAGIGSSSTSGYVKMSYL